MPAGRQSSPNSMSSRAAGRRSGKIIRRLSSTRKRCRARPGPTRAAGIDLSAIKNSSRCIACARSLASTALRGSRRRRRRADGEIEDVQLAVRGAPISRDADWLPAIEQFGEGIFIHFDEAAIGQWLAERADQARATTS